MGRYFALRARNRAFKYFSSLHFIENQGHHDLVSSPWDWKISPQVPASRAKVGQNHYARKAVSATLSVLKWSRAIFQPRSSKRSVQIFFLCPFDWKPRPSPVSLESTGLEYIPQIPANQAKVGQSQDGRKAILATLSVSKWSGAIFRPRSSKLSV